MKKKRESPFPSFVPVPSHANGFVPAPSWLKVSRKKGKKPSVRVRDR